MKIYTFEFITDKRVFHISALEATPVYQAMSHLQEDETLLEIKTLYVGYRRIPE